MNKRKVFMIMFIMILTISILGSVGTYAWYVWSTRDDEKTEIATEVGAAIVTYDAGSSMAGKGIKPVNNKSQGLVKNINIKTNQNTTSKISFNLYLDINTLDEGLKHESFKYELYKGSTLKKSGNFSQEYLDNNLVTCSKNSTNHIVLLSDEEVTTTLDQYTLYIWIDGANYTNPNTMQDANFNFKLHADGRNAVLKPPSTLVETITNLYTNATKEKVTNNNRTYNYAPSVNLMNDGLNKLGGSTSLDGGNIRYYGANPNNYIYFNCDEYPDTNCELWRIIGVFDGKVKIIRNKSIGYYSWDNKDTSTGAEDADGKNDWTTARLMKLLNPSDYYEIDTNDNGYGQSLYWNSESGTCFSWKNNDTVSCDFTSTGIKNDTTRNMISEVTWNLGGWANDQLNHNQMYGYERGTRVYSGRPTTWKGKIALMYPSDYGFATDFTKCNQYLNYYSDDACKTNDWLYNSASQWLLTPNSSFPGLVWNVYPSGVVNHYNILYNEYGVRPVLYLNSETIIESGSVGTSEDPFKISLG